MADKEQEDDGKGDVGTAKAKADSSTSEYRRQMYEDSWKGIEPKVRKEHEERIRKSLTGKTYPQGKFFPNFDRTPASEVHEDPKPGPFINVPLYDNKRSPK